MKINQIYKIKELLKNKGKEKNIENDENFNFDKSEKSFNNKNFSKIPK